MSIRSSIILDDAGPLRRIVLIILPVTLCLALAACNSGSASNSNTGSPVPMSPVAVAAAPRVTDDTGYITFTSASDGSKSRLVIPVEPANDFGAPSQDDDEDVGFTGYADGITSINNLADLSSGGIDKAFANAEDCHLDQVAIGRNNFWVGFGSILLAIWYQREHPGVSFADAANALKQDPPDIRKIKKAAHVARLWLTNSKGELETDKSDEAVAALVKQARPEPTATDGEAAATAPDAATIKRKLDVAKP